VVAAVPEARVAMLILTWLTIEQVATRYEEPTQTINSAFGLSQR
jgi:hypothetical protein